MRVPGSGVQVSSPSRSVWGQELQVAAACAGLCGISVKAVLVCPEHAAGFHRLGKPVVCDGPLCLLTMHVIMTDHSRCRERDSTS